MKRLVLVAVVALGFAAGCAPLPTQHAAAYDAGYSAPDLPPPAFDHVAGATPTYDGPALAPTVYQGQPHDVDGERVTIAPGGNYFSFDPSNPGCPFEILTEGPGRYDWAPWVPQGTPYTPGPCAGASS